jgi:hypothetical protein
MFNLETDERITAWVDHRNFLEISNSALQDCWNFWKSAPFIPHNYKIDPFYQRGWPSPWEIIRENKYDDFTKSLMIAWTLKLTEKFKNYDVQIKFFVDKLNFRQYTVVFVDNKWIINYHDEFPILVSNFDDSLMLQNSIEIARPR